MTKKHYIAIAKVLNEHHNVITIGDLENFDIMVESFCAVFKADNPLFDKTKFVNACYKEGV